AAPTKSSSTWTAASRTAERCNRPVRENRSVARHVDDLEQYRRPRLDEPDVVAMLERLGVDPETAEDLGGTMSLNVHLPQSGEVLRVHPRFARRSRVEALRVLRRLC